MENPKIPPPLQTLMFTPQGLRSRTELKSLPQHAECTAQHKDMLREHSSQTLVNSVDDCKSVSGLPRFKTAVLNHVLEHSIGMPIPSELCLQNPEATSQHTH